jgi:hypothetical protein
MITRTVKILIIGGYGTFGGRIAQLLSDNRECEIVIAGRSLDKAKAFAGCLSGLAKIEAATVDRNRELGESIGQIRPDIVIDASGPFQAYADDPYRVVEAAIANGANYIDLADDPAFVIGISRYTKSALDAGVFALSGVSTCPALTGAVFRRIARGFASIDCVEGGIAPSPYSGVGLSVVQAIAAYAGQEISVIENGQKIAAYPFTEPRRFTISPPGGLPLRSLNFSLVDVPDLHLLGDKERPIANVWFGAAPVPAIYHTALRGLARAVKRGLLPSLALLARPMFEVMNHFNWGEHRGGLFLECRGLDSAGNRLVRSWLLVAEGNAGPMTPALAAVAIIQRIQAGTPPHPGARAAHQELKLEDFEPLLLNLDVWFGEREGPIPGNRPLFRRVLGSAWALLPKPIAALHEFDSRQRYAGQAIVTRGRSIFARIAGWLIGFPVSGEHVPVVVEMKIENHIETWCRDFDGHRFSSTMSEGEGSWAHLVCERFGPIRFGIALVPDDEKLHYVMRRWSCVGIPMPLFLRPKGAMYESVQDGRFCFHVELVFPIFGHIVTYSGWLAEQAAETVQNLSTLPES